MSYIKEIKQMVSNTDKLTIAAIMQSPDIGGAEMYMLSLMEYFVKDKNNVMVGSNKSKFLTRAKEHHVETFELPFILDIMGDWKGLIKSILLLPYALFFYSKKLLYLRQKKVDVILMSGFTEKLFVSFLASVLHIPVVWIEYGRLETVFKRNFYLPKVLYRLIKDIPQSVIVPSNNTKQSLITDARVSLAKLKLIPCGITIHKKISNAKKKVLPDWEGNIIIGSVSRLTREKGQQFLIKAVPEIVKKEPKARFIIIGDGPDKDYFNNLIKELHIEDTVKILGFVNNVPEYYSAMDIFVFPTIWELEGFGLVTPEAMSYDLPVVASALGPVPEIIDNNVNGLLVPPEDEHAIARAVITLIQDQEKRREFGKNGRKKVEEYYDIEKVSKKILEVLQEATLK